MAKSEKQKLKLLVLKDYLEQNSDEEHPVSIAQMVDYLASQGIPAERKSLYSDIAFLEEYGLDILHDRGKNGGYYLASRTFELPELKLLSDAVQSCKFLSHKKSLDLIQKLEGLTSHHQASQLRRQVVVSGRVKSMNESIYYNVDRIHEAIADGVTITFRYFNLGPDKEKVFRDKTYQVSPHALCWQDENYYLIATSPDHGITHYRVDKMDHITATTEKALAVDLDLSAYTKAVFSMFGGNAISVQLRFHKSMVGVILDRFGKDIMLVPDGEYILFTTDIVLSPIFYGWLTSLAPKVQIVRPQSAAEEYKSYLQSALEAL